MDIMKLIYRSNSVAREFSKKMPDERILSIEPSKVLSNVNFNPEVRKMNWLFSERKNTILTDNFLIYGKQIFKKKELREKKVILLKTFFNFISYQVISFRHNDRYYYIGMNFNSLWIDNMNDVEIMNDNKRSYVPIVLIVLAFGFYIISKVI